MIRWEKIPGKETGKERLLALGYVGNLPNAVFEIHKYCKGVPGVMLLIDLSGSGSAGCDCKTVKEAKVEAGKEFAEWLKDLKAPSQRRRR